jgi:hypothetical protein
MNAKHKSKMYACIVFFETDNPKRWKYVRDLKSFESFLSRDHPSWKYFNVYEKGSKQFLKRFYQGNSIPRILCFLLLILLTHKFTFSRTTFDNRQTLITSGAANLKYPSC